MGGRHHAELIDRAGPAGERHVTTLSPVTGREDQCPSDPGPLAAGYAVPPPCCAGDEHPRRRAPLRRPLRRRVADAGADRGDAALGHDPAIAATLERRRGSASRLRLQGRCNHRDLGQVAHRLPLTMRCSGSAVAAVAGVSRVPVAGVAVTGIQRSFSLIPPRYAPMPLATSQRRSAHLRPGPAHEDRQIEDATPRPPVPRRCSSKKPTSPPDIGVLATPASSPSPHPPSKNSAQPFAAIGQAAIQASCRPAPRRTASRRRSPPPRSRSAAGSQVDRHRRGVTRPCSGQWIRLAPR